MITQKKNKEKNNVLRLKNQSTAGDKRGRDKKIIIFLVKKHSDQKVTDRQSNRDKMCAENSTTNPFIYWIRK